MSVDVARAGADDARVFDHHGRLLSLTQDLQRWSTPFFFPKLKSLAELVVAGQNLLCLHSGDKIKSGTFLRK